MNPKAKRAFKDALYEQFARIGKALSSGRRLELMEVLAQGERSVEGLAEHAGMSVANTSQHLQLLRAARLVEVRKDGLFARYRISNDRALRLWLALREFGELENGEIQRVVRHFLQDHDSLEAITVEELRGRLKESDLVLIDVRPELEYRSGHIRGAISVPLEELEHRVKQLSRRKEIVAYCRGPYCVFAHQAVRVLRARGYQAKRLNQGFPEWKILGLPTEVSEGGVHGARN